MRPYARMLAKVAHASPISVTETLVQLVRGGGGGGRGEGKRLWHYMSVEALVLGHSLRSHSVDTKPHPFNVLHM